MKSPFVAELEPNRPVSTLFLVHHKDIRQKKTGEPYLSLVLGDRTGELDAKMWDNVAEVMETFDRDDFVKVKGLLQIYQNRPQFTIHKMMRVDEREVDLADFFPASKRAPDEMFAELTATIAGLTNPHLKALLEAVFADDEVARRYRTAPAAKGIHHAWLGGLIEHVLSLCRLAKLTAAHYENVDLDLLLTGCILHDLGKIHELNYDRTFCYSSDGQLLGHIAIGLRMIGDRLARIPDFPPRLRNLVEHMVLSHHGELEFGSPKMPMFPEALLLHHLDNLDSKMESMRAALDKDRTVEGCWTGYNQALERTVLKKRKYLEERDGEPARPARARRPEAAPSRPAPESQPLVPGDLQPTLPVPMPALEQQTVVPSAPVAAVRPDPAPEVPKPHVPAVPAPAVSVERPDSPAVPGLPVPAMPGPPVETPHRDFRPPIPGRPAPADQRPKPQAPARPADNRTSDSRPQQNSLFAEKLASALKKD